MGRQLSGWGELGGTGGVDWLDSWKKAGFLKLVLHREPPWLRNLHNFRRLFTKEQKNKPPEKKVVWYPWVCWEPEEYHKLLRTQKDKPPRAEHCPGCRFIEHLKTRDDLPDDSVIFKFVGTGRGEMREILKVDFMGLGDTKQGFQDSFIAKTDYVIAIIALNDPSKIVLTNEKWSLGKALHKRIKTDIQLYGEDDGDPSKKPIAYTFEYDEATQNYGVSRLEGFECTEQIQELWASDAPDAGRYCDRGNPKRLLEQMQLAAETAEMEFPFDEIFAPALAAWDEADEKDDSTSFNPEDFEDEGDKTPPKAQAKEAERKPPKKQEPKKEPAPKKEAAPKKEPEKKEEAPPADPPKRTRGAKKPEPPPEPEPAPEPEVEVFACSECGGDFPSNLKICPNGDCGAVADVEEGDVDPPPPAEQKKTKPLGRF